MSKLHLVRRTDLPFFKKVLLYVLSIVLSLCIGAVLLAALGIDPVAYYKNMLTIGLLGNKYPGKSIEGFLKIFVPLLIVSLALALSFRMKFWNVGGEGEFIAGAIMAAWVAFKFGDLPTPVVILMMSLSAALASGIIGLAVAWLKIKFNTNETLVTLMINYIMLYVIRYLGETKADWNFFLREDSERPIFGKFPDNATMPAIKIGNFNLLYTVPVAAIIAVIIYFYLKKTKQGYEIAVVGDSSDTARYAGINVKKVILRTMFISAALVGLAGAFTASSSATISSSITNNVGWTGVIVAWLAKLSTPGIAIASFLISILQYGCQAAATSYPAVDRNYADLLQGLILFSILAADFFINFKIAKKKKEDKYA
ncbi:MAG: ABC transporter permease [Clostridiales bacterium]|nr:ABC transporter permease [Clostridiales bacterium]